MKQVEFLVDNQKLKGTLFFPQNIKPKNPSVLFIQGWTGEKERSYQYAEALAKLGFICFLPDLRGHGESEGDKTVLTNKDFLADVVAAYDFFLKIGGVDAQNISAIGSSFGGFLVALLSSKRDLASLVLRVPADYSNEVFNSPKAISNGNEPGVMEWRAQHKKPRDTYALTAINNFQNRVLIIESELDDRIPHATIENYINAVKNKSKLTHVVIKNAPHSIKEGPFRNEVEKILKEWFKKF